MQFPLVAARVLFGVLFVVITYLTLTPNPDDTEPGFIVTRWISTAVFGDDKLADKIAHFLSYATLGAAAFLAQVNVFSRRWGAWAALCLYGILLEVLQGLGGVRDPEIWDAVCNALGAAAGLGGAFSLAWIVKRARGLDKEKTPPDSQDVGGVAVEAAPSGDAAAGDYARDA